MMGKRILITGGCGFIGANLIAFLQSCSSRFELRVFDNESLGDFKNIESWDVEFQKGDLRDFEAVKQAVDGVDGVIHLAADTRVIDSIEFPHYNFNVNVIGSLNLLLAMREKGVESIISASTGGAILGEVSPPVREDMPAAPASPYGASKLAVEGYMSAFVASYGMKACSLRFSNVYGPRSLHKGSVIAAFFRRVLENAPLTIYGDGSQMRDYIYIDDLCRGILLAMEKGAQGVFQLGTGVPTSLSQLLTIMSEIVAPQYRLIVEHEAFRQGELRHTWCDISKANLELGFFPEYALPIGLQKTWEWFLSLAS